MSDTQLLCIVVVASCATQAAMLWFNWQVYQRMTDALDRIANYRPGRARSGVVQRRYREVEER